MKNRKIDVIDVDQKEFAMYYHKKYDYKLAITRVESSRLFQLSSKYVGFENVPPEEKTMAIRLQYNIDKDAYDIQSKIFEEVPVNELVNGLMGNANNTWW